MHQMCLLELNCIVFLIYWILKHTVLPVQHTNYPDKHETIYHR